MTDAKLMNPKGAFLTRRRFLEQTGVMASAAGLVLVAGRSAFSANWRPTESIEMVVPFGAGGGTDRSARSIQRFLEDLGIVEQAITATNMPGAGGAIGLEYLVNQEPDGHTICLHSAQLVQSNITGRSPYNHTDVTPFARLAQQVVSYAVRADSSIKDAEELLDRLKADPKSVSITTGSAVGNNNHLGISMVASSIGIDPLDLNTVVFSSGAEGMTAILGGHIEVGITSPEQFLPHVESGDLRFLAISAEERMEGEMADVPTWRELGVDSVAGNWYVVVGPKGMAEPQARYWEDAFAELSASPEWNADLDERNMRNAYLDREATAAFLEKEYNDVKKIMTDLGLAS